MKNSWMVAGVLAVGLVLAVQPLTVLAQKEYPAKLLAMLSILHKDNQENCKICHTQIKNPETGKKDPKWNVFGEAMKKAKAELKEKTGQAPTFEAMFNAVQDADADEDGVSNILELVVGTQPGSKDSKPTEEQIKEAQVKLTQLKAPKAE